MSEASDDPARREARARALEGLAESVRALVDRVVRTEAPLETLDDWSRRIDDLARDMEPFTRVAGPGALPSVRHARDPHRFLPHSMISGLRNPLAPPVRLDVLDDKVVGRAVFHTAYEGPPGYVHGAMVAGVLDQVLAFANLASGQYGFTARLTIRYHKPTPLFREIRFEAKHERTEGKRIHTTGSVWDGDVLTADAEGIFVGIDEERAREYFPHVDDPRGDRSGS